MINHQFHMHILENAQILGYWKSVLEFRGNHSYITAEILIHCINTYAARGSEA